MAFHVGQRVEVASKADGFVGSYYEATIVQEITPKKEYIVQYKNLVTDDFSAPLQEIVTFPELRPLPPLNNLTVAMLGVRESDRVDAFDNDGWWVGTVAGRVGRMYHVFFESTGDMLPYDMDRLRVHRDWINGKWVTLLQIKKDN